MNKQEILEQIDELKQKIEVLEKKVNSLEFEGIKKSVRQMPEYEEKYFFVDSCGSIDYQFWEETKTDLFRFNTGNCFKTKQEAIDFKENLLTKQQLKDLALELNNGVEIDWEDDNELKFYINFCRFQQDLCLHNKISYPDIGQVYCLNENFLTVAKERIGEEKLIKLIKSGV